MGGLRTTSATHEPSLVDLAAFPAHEATFFDSRFGAAKLSVRGLRTSTATRKPVVVDFAADRARLSVFADSDHGHTLGQLPPQGRSIVGSTRGVHTSTPTRKPVQTAATRKQVSSPTLFAGELGHTARRGRPASSLPVEKIFPTHEASFPDSRFDRFPVHEASFPNSRYPEVA